MKLDEHITNIYKQNEDFSITSATIHAKSLAAYIFYHYMNADTSRLEELTNSLVDIYLHNSLSIGSILNSCTNDNAIDFICILTEDDFTKYSLDQLLIKVRQTATIVGSIIYHNEVFATKETIAKYDELGTKIDNDTAYVLRIICPFNIEINQKILYQQSIAEIKVNNSNMYFDLIFLDDIEEEINDFEKPKEYVANGSLNLFSKNICTFGDENSFIGVISAKSLKRIFMQHSTKGLFASNLRFYITNKKIDGKIVETIQNEPENFVYYNNGIIITCDNFFVKDMTVSLENFSIVNGGQTTNLIGRTYIDEDFGLICKVIKLKNTNSEERINFLSKVAEASNMQKPINAKDLIANRVEQRALKKQFLEAGMFLKIKRGEKLDKRQFPFAYMNASNDEVAQLLNAYVFQSPGSSKSTKSSLLTNERIYNQIFKNEYNSDFFKSMQIFKVSYSDWQKKKKKTEPHSSVKFSLSKHANYVTFALIGFIFKFFINKTLSEYIENTEIYKLNAKNVEFKEFLKVNDIGNESLISIKYMEELQKNSFFELFDYLFDEFLIPSYNKFKKENPSLAYANFCKTDGHYYDYLLQYTIKKLLETNTIDKLLIKFGLMNLNRTMEVAPKKTVTDFSTNSLEDELTKFRQDEVIRQENKIKPNNVITRMQISKIAMSFPRSNEDLSLKCSLSDNQIKKYGNSILTIVKKYIREEDFQ